MQPMGITEITIQDHGDGLAGIQLGTWSITTVVYKNFKDGEIKFKKGWKEFVMRKTMLY